MTEEVLPLTNEDYKLIEKENTRLVLVLFLMTLIFYGMAAFAKSVIVFIFWSIILALIIIAKATNKNEEEGYKTIYTGIITKKGKRTIEKFIDHEVQYFVVMDKKKEFIFPYSSNLYKSIAENSTMKFHESKGLLFKVENV